MSGVGSDRKYDNFTSNCRGNPRCATGSKKVKIANPMRTGGDINDIWLSMNECHIVHMNHGTFDWRLSRYRKVVGVGLAPPDQRQSVTYAK